MVHKHEDTTVKINGPFDEAIRKLARAKRAGSQAGESGRTTSHAAPKPGRTATSATIASTA